MSFEHQSHADSPSKWVEVRSDQEVDPYLDAYQYAADVRPYYNRNQLAGVIDDAFLSKVVDAANAGDFVPADDDPRKGHSGAYEGSALDILGLMRGAAAAKAVGNADWKEHLPDNESVRAAAISFMEDSRLSRPFANALRARIETLVRDAQDQWKESSFMTPEEWEAHETRTDMAGVALDAPGVQVTEPIPVVIDSEDVPKVRGTYQAPVKIDGHAMWMPPTEQPRRASHVDHDSFVIGDTVSVPYPSHDPETGKIIPNSYTYVTYTMRGTSTVEGTLMAVFKNDAGVAEYIPMDIVNAGHEREDEIRQLLGGIDIDNPPILADVDEELPQIEAEPTAETAVRIAEDIKERIGVPRHVAIASPVFIKVPDDTLKSGVFLGFYNEGDEDVSDRPKKYAAIRLQSDEVIGVHADEVKHDTQQEVKRTLFRQSDSRRSTPTRR